MSRARELALSAGAGACGAVLFLFAFPMGSISTLMHAVLHLPGPGAGIALLLGPFLILVALNSWLLSRSAGGVLAACLGFAVCCALVIRLFSLPTEPKGAFGSWWFIAAVTLSGLAVEAVMFLGRTLSQTVRWLLAGALGNVVLLLFYWVAIFPRTAGWVKWRDIPLLMAVCLGGGLLSGYVARISSRALSRALDVQLQE
jgi:hypothetical protein